MAHISDPHFAERVRASFEQQHGFVHGGVVGMIADSAAGYAAMTMVPASASVLTVMVMHGKVEK